jgi:hypothetical protein
MPPTNSDPRELKPLIPEVLYNAISDRIKAGISDAEALFDVNEEDEDAVTGALGQAISTPNPLIYNGPEGLFEYNIRSFKTRGKGPGAPEKKLGADAVFQIAVFHEGNRLFTKALPFQAKKTGGFHNQKVQLQAKGMQQYFGSGVIVRYSKTGYRAVDIREMVDRDGTILDKDVTETKLSTVFGNDFLACKIGSAGSYFTVEDVSQLLERATIIDTTVKRIEPGRARSG